MESLKVAFTTGFYDPADQHPSDYPRRAFTLHYLARELNNRGHRVHIIAPFHQRAQFVKEGVPYSLIRAPLLNRAAARAAQRLLGGFPHPYYEITPGVVSGLRADQPEIIHFFGMTLDPALCLISRYAASHRIPLVLHYHGGQPATNPVRKALQVHNLARASAVLFTASEQARAWIEAGLIDPPVKALEFLENSTFFQPVPRDEARRATGMDGNPVFLSVARLVPDKDPLTVLEAFALIRRRWVGAKLYFYYLRDDLAGEMEHRIRNSPELSDSVYFCGGMNFDAMAAIYSSADFLVQASLREHGGQAVLEAIACGVIPVVTDIPSFRRMTSGGQYGRLFPIGDYEELARQVLSYDLAALQEEGQHLRTYFDDALSFPALACQLEEIYRSLGARRADPPALGH